MDVVVLPPEIDRLSIHWLSTGLDLSGGVEYSLAPKTTGLLSSTVEGAIQTKVIWFLAESKIVHTIGLVNVEQFELEKPSADRVRPLYQTSSHHGRRHGRPHPINRHQRRFRRRRRRQRHVGRLIPKRRYRSANRFPHREG
jgi:hypothetical protein